MFSLDSGAEVANAGAPGKVALNLPSRRIPRPSRSQRREPFHPSEVSTSRRGGLRSTLSNPAARPSLLPPIPEKRDPGSVSGNSRYKAVVVNGEGSGEYFRIVADYIHLNPVRSGWVGGSTGKMLMDWAWSSFPLYGRRKAPEWLVTERVVESFRLSPEGRGRRAYVGYLEECANDREGTLTDDSLKALRRGWYLGEEGFRDKVLDAMVSGLRAKRRKGSIAGEAARSHDEAEAERIVELAATELGLPSGKRDLEGRGVYRDEKALISWLVRKRTSASNSWVAERLAMGHPTSVSRASGRVRREPSLARRGRRLEEAVAVVLRITD